MERVLGLVRECRVVLGALEGPPKPGESPSAKAERILYYTLMGAIDAGGCPPGPTSCEPAVWADGGRMAGADRRTSIAGPSTWRSGGLESTTAFPACR